jgi:hypothetical protein
MASDDELDFSEAFHPCAAPQSELLVVAAALPFAVQPLQVVAAAPPPAQTWRQEHAACGGFYGGPLCRSEEQVAQLTRVMRLAKKNKRADAKRSVVASSGAQGYYCDALVVAEGAEITAKRLKHWRAVPTQSILCASFSSGTVTSISKEHNLSRSFVRKSVQAVAFTWLERQDRALKDALTAIQDNGISIFLDTLRHDSTKQKLLVDTHELLLASQRVSSWSVMVSVSKMCWVTHDGELHVFPFLRPPVVCVGSENAGCLWDALFGQPFLVAALDFCREARKHAQTTVSAREMDAASTGFRTIAWEGEEFRKDAMENVANANLHSIMPCGLHQVNTVTREVLKPINSLQCISSAYSHAKLQREGNYFTRLVFGAELECETWQVVFIPPDPRHLQLRDMILATFFPRLVVPRRSSDMSTAEWEEALARRRAKHQMRIQAVKEVWNCDPFGPRVHHCFPPGHCKDHQDFQRKLKIAFCRNSLAARCKAPQLKEWTAVAQSLRWHCLGICWNSMLPTSLERSCQKLRALAPRCTAPAT